MSTLLPILTLGALGAVVPIGLAGRFKDTLWGLVRALAVSVVVLVLSGSVLFVLIYGDQGVGLDALAASPGPALLHFGALGLKSALVWGPVTALAGLVLAQGVERRRGARMAARDQD
ncbi:MAG: hypothetical protein AAGK37_20940 [Pseudomonadota bacterium]